MKNFYDELKQVQKANNNIAELCYLTVADVVAADVTDSDHSQVMEELSTILSLATYSENILNSISEIEKREFVGKSGQEEKIYDEIEKNINTLTSLNNELMNQE